MCFFLAFLGPAPFVVEILVLVLLACSRVHALRRANNFRADPGTLKKLVALAWFAGIIYSVILTFAIKGNTAVYVPVRFRCAPANFSNPQYKAVNMLLTCFVIFIPMVVILGANMFILVKISMFSIKKRVLLSDPPTLTGLLKSNVFKSNGNRSSQQVSIAINRCNNGNPAVTISIICCVFVISYTPLLVFILLQTPNVPDWFQIFFTHCLSLNITVNPFIYALMNTRFRNYIMDICFDKEISFE